MSDEQLPPGFRQLNIKVEVQDEIMSHFEFVDVAQMFEAGVLILHAYATAQKAGMTKGYFARPKDGKTDLVEFDVSALVEYLKDPLRIDGSVHKIKIEDFTP